MITNITNINASKYSNPIIEYNMSEEFLIEELKLIQEWKKVNLSYWKKIHNQNEEDIEEKDSLEDIINDELGWDLDEDLDEDLDDRIETYKWKRDFNKINNIINHFQLYSNPMELYFIMDSVYKDEYRKKHLILTGMELDEDLKYIFSEYNNFYNSLKDDIELKESITNIDYKKEKNFIKTLDLFISHLIELKNQINDYNDVKDDILKYVYLAKQWDEQATEYIIKNIVKKEAERMAIKYSSKNWSIDYDLYNDLVQDAYVSSMKGIDIYDYTKNDNFVYYIRYWIKQWISKWIESKYNAIKIPSHIIQMFSKIKNLQNQDSLESEIDEITHEWIKMKQNNMKVKIADLRKEKRQLNDGRDKDRLSNEIKILEEMSKSETKNFENIRKKIENTIKIIWTNSVSSMWNMLRNMEDDETDGLESNIFIDKDADIESMMKNKERDDELKDLLSTVLTEEQQIVVIRSFGIFGEEMLSLESIWKLINKSAERVRQILQTSCERLSIRMFDKEARSLSPKRKMVEQR